MNCLLSSLFSSLLPQDMSSLNCLLFDGNYIATHTIGTIDRSNIQCLNYWIFVDQVVLLSLLYTCGGEG